MSSRTILYAGVSAVVVMLAAAVAYGFLIAPFRLLASMPTEPSADLTVWAIAVDCRWRYRYLTPAGNVEVDPAATCTTAACRLGLDPAGALVVPVGRTVGLTVASDTDKPLELLVPTLGLRIEAVPGAIRESYFKAFHEGHYIGTPSPACARDPRSIPVGIRAVDAQTWRDWLAGLAAGHRRP